MPKNRPDILLISFPKFILYAGLVLGIYLFPTALSAQNSSKTDTANVQLNYHEEAASFDTIHSQSEALDIASDRGLFILSSDRKMQMRILGSVRAAINYSDQALSSKSSLNPYEIPTNIPTISPNYFASLSQTRIGFEVTRKTAKRGDVFIRIETDFASSTNNLRIRHAYGQFTHLLVGQTWSLFSNVNDQPATVNFDGVVGSISIRTAQLRYSKNFNKYLNWAVGIEYSIPDFFIPDSIQVSLLQVIPDLTGQISYKKDQLSCHLSAVITTISGRDTTNEISYGFGFGASIGGHYKFLKRNKVYISFTSGRAISHFVSMFGGKREDAAYNPNNQKFEPLSMNAGFIAYEYDFNENLTANISYGMGAITNKYFQEDDAFSHAYTAMFNLFWQPVEGARLGVEYANGMRFNKGGDRGLANKISMLLYYDF